MSASKAMPSAPATPPSAQFRVLLMFSQPKRADVAAESHAPTDNAILKDYFSKIVGAQVSGGSFHDDHIAVDVVVRRITKFFKHHTDIPVKVLVFRGTGRPGSGNWVFDNGDLPFSKILELWEEQRQRLSNEQQQQGKLLILSDSCYSGQLCAQAAASGATGVYVQASCGEHEEIQDGRRFHRILSLDSVSYSPTHNIQRGVWCALSQLFAGVTLQDLKDRLGSRDMMQKTRSGGVKLEIYGPTAVWQLAVWMERNSGRPPCMMTEPNAKTVRMIVEEHMQMHGSNPAHHLFHAIQFVLRFRLEDFAVQEGADDKTRALAKKHMIVLAREEDLTGEVVCRLDACLNAIFLDIIPLGPRKPELALVDEFMYLADGADDCRHFFTLPECDSYNLPRRRCAWQEASVEAWTGSPRSNGSSSSREQADSTNAGSSAPGSSTPGSSTPVSSRAPGAHVSSSSVAGSASASVAGSGESDNEEVLDDEVLPHKRAKFYPGTPDELLCPHHPWQVNTDRAALLEILYALLLERDQQCAAGAEELAEAGHRSCTPDLDD